MYEACFRVSLKHASLWGEMFRKLRLKGLQMEMILGERGVDVDGQRPCTKHVSGLDMGGQRPCTKHVSGLVSNMLRCGVKCSGN